MESTNNDGVSIAVNQLVFFRSLGTTYKVLSQSIGGSAAIVEHTLQANCIGAPMHKHTYENEISYVIEGHLAVMQDGEVQMAYPGEFIVQPKGIFHTFWNPGRDKVRFIHVITPGNFEYYFAEIEPFLKPGQPPEMDKIIELRAKYGLIIDPTGVDEITKKYGLNPLK